MAHKISIIPNLVEPHKICISIAFSGFYLHAVVVVVTVVYTAVSLFLSFAVSLSLSLSFSLLFYMQNLVNSALCFCLL